MKKHLILYLSILSSVVLFSVGYATWTIKDEILKLLEGTLNAEELNKGNVTELVDVTINNLKPPFDINQDGIIVDEEFKNRYVLSYNFKLDNSTVKTNSVKYECRLKVSNLNAKIDTYLNTFNVTNGSVDSSFANGFGPYASLSQEHISHIDINKTQDAYTSFKLTYDFNNFYDLFEGREIVMDLTIKAI